MLFQKKKSDKKSYAAGKPKNEDDIKNKCYSIDDKTEKIEVLGKVQNYIMKALEYLYGGYVVISS